MAIQTISQMPPAPTPADNPTDFATKAAAFVPAMDTMGTELNQYAIDIVRETNETVETAQDNVNITAKGIFDAVVVGDTDGLNTEFTILNASFYPYWMLFVDGKKIANENITMSGNIATLAIAPISGATVEAVAPLSSDFIAPSGYKTIAFCSNKSGTINITCSSNGSLPKWKVNNTETESASFSYINDGSYIYIYLYVPDNSTNTDLDATDSGLFLIQCENDVSINDLDLRNNVGLTYIESLVNINNIDDLQFAFYQCGLTSFPLLDTSNVTSFNYAWRDNNLTSFPLLDTSNVTSFDHAWRDNNLTSFPLLDTSNVTSFNQAWYNNNLTSFPLLDSPNVTSFYAAWQNNNLTSFPLLDSSNVTIFNHAWRDNNLTSFPSNFFDNCVPSAIYNNAFYNNSLNETSVNNILISINNSGAANVTIGLNGGTNASPTGAGLTAKSELESRGCTVNVN